MVAGRVTEVADVVVRGNDVDINVELPSNDRSQESTSSSCEFLLLVARVVLAVADIVVEGLGGVADDKLPIVDEIQISTSCPVWPDMVSAGKSKGSQRRILSSLVSSLLLPPPM